jgi:hypothetical protein
MSASRKREIVNDVVEPEDLSMTNTPPKNNEPIMPRAEAAEKRVDFSALRDIANLSAEDALGKFTRKQLTSAQRTHAMLTLGALIAGVAMIWYWYSHHAGNLFALGAGACLTVACYCGLQYAILSGRLFVHKSGKLSLRKDADERQSARENGETSENADSQNAQKPKA